MLRIFLAGEAGGLNAIRLLLPDWSGCTEKFDSTAGEFLLKAEALNLQVVLDLPAVPGFLAILDSLLFYVVIIFYTTAYGLNDACFEVVDPRFCNVTPPQTPTHLQLVT